jgi:hypothetical protein
MKKFMTMLLAMVLMVTLTACKEEQSDAFNQEVADSTISMLNEYYEGMRNADFDLTFKNYPEFYVNNVKLELEYYGGTEDEYLSTDNATWYTENYGEDATISLEVVSTTLMTKAVTKKYNKLVVNLYQEKATIQNVYTVILNKTISGELATDTTQVDWTILQIDDQYWLYDTYFEDMADSLSTSNAVTTGDDDTEAVNITYVVS